MPDQLPAAILDSTNSFDSLFALDLDTKQRFDNALNGIQKPIDYPIPDYNKEMTPAGLPQDDLLNPDKMKGSIGEGLFSSDPRIAAYATDKIRASQSRLPVNQGVGVPDRFAYSKEMDKYLKGDFGYNPYQSLEDNEDFNYRYDYLNQGLAERIFKNVGVGLGRFVGSVVLKLGQTVGYMGSVIGNGVEEIFNSKDNNFMADVADNSLSRWFEGIEEDMKISSTLSVFKPRGWEDKGFFSKLGNGAFWTDEVADGAAFMGEMVASMYLLGGLGKIGAVGRLGATEINLTKALGKLGSVGRYGGKTLDFALKTATGAENLSGVGRWAFSTASESAFEASQLYHTRKDQLKADRQSGHNTYSDTEIEAIAGDSAAASFKANLLILSASNAFENKFIFNPLFKKLGKEVPDPRGRLIHVSDGTGSLDELARASRKEYNYSTWVGKKLDWKNSNSRLRFYGSRGLSAIAAEGFWEENAQLATERLAGADNLSFSTFAKKLKDQTLSTVKAWLPGGESTDPEAETNIGLGGLIGIGGTSIVSKVRGGDRLFQGERRKREEDTLKAVSIYEQYRKNFLNFQDVYVRDAAGKPVLDADGNMEVDEVKAAGILDGMNAFASKQEAASKVYDPLFRKHLQDQAMMDYVVAAKSAGIYDRATKRFNALGELKVGDLQNLGFDPNTTVDAPYLQDSMKEFGRIYDSVQNSPAAKRGKNDTPEDEVSRKQAMYKASANVYSNTKLINEFQAKMLDRDFPSAFSPEAEGNTSEIQMYNSLVYQKEAMDQWTPLAQENGNFYDGFIRSEKRRIDAEMRRLETILDDMMDTTALNIQATPRGFIVSTDKYDHLTPSAAERLREVDALQEGNKRTIAKMRNDAKDSKAMRETEMSLDIENQAQRKHAQYTNIRAKHQYLTNKFGNLEDGIKNYKDYMRYEDNIQKKDADADGETTPTQPPPDPTPPSTGPTAPVIAPTTPDPTLTPKETAEAGNIITSLSNMLSVNNTLHAQNNPNNLPDYNVIGAYINDNIEANRPALEKVLLDFVRDFGEVLMDQIRNGTYNVNNTSVPAYENAALFMDSVMENVQDEDIVNKVFDYLDSVDDAVKAYKPVVVELTEDEQTAITVLAGINLTTGKLAPYAAILNDPSTSAKDKQEALRYISDQYLAPATTDEIGIALGRAGSEAIENLNYPAPEETAALTDVVGSGSTMASDALIGSISDRMFAGMTLSPEEEEFYQENKDAIDERIEALKAKQKADAATSEREKIKADIERRRQEQIKEFTDANINLGTPEKTLTEGLILINAKYDAELAELEGPSVFDTMVDKDGQIIPLSEFNTQGETDLPPTDAEIAEPETQAEEAAADTEGSGVDEALPPTPPEPPQIAQNSDESAVTQENFIDVQVDAAKINGIFSFPQNMPEEVVMEGEKAKITNGAIQLKTTSGDQQNQLLRQHNILRKMGDRHQPENFWSEDQEGNPKYKIRLELAGFRNEAKYTPWIYNTAKGKISPVTGKPYLFPYILAMVTDQNGGYVYFDDNGNVSTKAKGKPFGFPYAVEDYKSENLDISRRGVQLGTMEPLNGAPGFMNDNPLGDLSTALQRGVEIYGSIDMVTSGKLSTYNVDNSGATWAKVPQQRSVQQMIKDGDVDDQTPVVLTSGNFITVPLATLSDTRTQQIKIGQPFLFDERSGLKIPLRGKKIKDLTVDGKPFVTGQLLEAIQALSEFGKVNIPAEMASAENQQLMENFFNTLRALVYSRDTPIFINEDRTQITMLDNRPTSISLMESEINFSTNISILSDPFMQEDEGFSYDEFVKENFLSGAIPAELTKGQKAFEKLNQRVIFTLEKNHQQILDSIGANSDNKRSIRMQMTDFSKFVNKTYRKKGGNSTVTVTGYGDGKFTIAGPSGIVTQTEAEFMKNLRTLEEVKLPAPTEEVKADFENNIKLSQEDEKRLNEEAKNMTKDDLDNINFDC